MPSDRRIHRGGFTVLEVVVVAAILCLMILALLPALRRGNGEQHFHLQPRPARPAVPPEPPAASARAPIPAPATPMPTLR